MYNPDKVKEILLRIYNSPNGGMDINDCCELMNQYSLEQEIEFFPHRFLGMINIPQSQGYVMNIIKQVISYFENLLNVCKVINLKTNSVLKIYFGCKTLTEEDIILLKSNNEKNTKKIKEKNT